MLSSADLYSQEIKISLLSVQLSLVGGHFLPQAGIFPLQLSELCLLLCGLQTGLALVNQEQLI